MVAALLAMPAATSAQGPRFTVNFGIGPTLPVGHLGSRIPDGYNAVVGAGLTLGSTWGLRAEGLYNRFGARNNYAVVCVDGVSCSRRSFVLGGTLNLERDWRLPFREHRGPGHRGGTAAAYVVGGFGFFSMHAPVVGGATPAGVYAYENRTRAYTGWNAGGGIRAPLELAFLYVEARVHSLNPTGTQIVPITVGLVF
ncbi:MAG TPA: hypothetical protein VFT41_10740 [Gemmatimonadaceae bacterium]|nr:hypothetical protein [Gemmatimonadaceae bacterium]